MTISNSNPIKPTLPNNASSFVPNEKSLLNENLSDVARYQANRFDAEVLQKGAEENTENERPLTRFEQFAAQFGGFRDPTTGNLTVAGFWAAMHKAIDPDDLVGQFRRGEIPPSLLTGEEGQVIFTIIQDRISQMQAVVDALRGILEQYNRAAMEAAKAIGR